MNELDFSQYRLNYVFDPPSDKCLYRSTLTVNDETVDLLPKKVDHRVKFGPILDQQSLGTCVSHTVVYQLRFLLACQSVPVALSRLFIHYNGRAVLGSEGRPTAGPSSENAGMSIRNGFRAVGSHGVCLEADWPYDVNKVFDRPPQFVYEHAAKYRNILYFTILQDLPSIKSCLHKGYVISFGMTLFASFMSTEVAQTGYVPVPDESKDQQIGAHAMTIVGYDDRIESVIVANQWSSRFGDEGYCYIKYEMILNPRMTRDLWYVRSITVEKNAAEAAPEAWVAERTYKSGDLVLYQSLQYKCVTTHKAIRSWTPPSMKSLWRRI